MVDFIVGIQKGREPVTVGPFSSLISATVK